MTRQEFLETLLFKWCQQQIYPDFCPSTVGLKDYCGMATCTRCKIKALSELDS